VLFILYVQYKKVIQMPLAKLYEVEKREHEASVYRSPFMSGSHK
jgi:hypothetical protein